MNLLTKPYAVPLVSNQPQYLNNKNNTMQIQYQMPSVSDQNKAEQSCINKVCKKYIYCKKSVVNDPLKLCSDCLIQYNNQNYCLYCKQIYFQESDDGKQWILCQQCSRWVHSECANFDPLINKFFVCIKCRNNQQMISRVNSNVADKKINKTASKIQRRKTNECSLNSFGFYWELGPLELAEDMTKIKQFLK